MHTISSEIRGDRGRRRRTHSAEFKAHVVAACRHPGVSIASVAMANGVNANLARRWMIEDERATDGAELVSGVVQRKSSAPTFVPLQLLPPAQAPATADIRIELRRGATAITVSWPSSAAAACGAWMRELLR